MSADLIPYFSKTMLAKIKVIMLECYALNTTNHSTLVNESYSTKEDGPICPRIFDTLSCWDPIPAGAVAYQKCPDFVVGFDGDRMSYKTCTDNGTWAKHPQGSTPWTNYTNCVNVEDLAFRNKVNMIYVIGYTISVIALLLSLGIFRYFRMNLQRESRHTGRDRSLKCARIKIHMHLFLSFVVNNVLWIVWYQFVVNDVSVVQNNAIWCQVLHVVTHYFMVCNYMWMANEALHLHISLVVVFVREDRAMKWFKIIGWFAPAVIVGLYAIVRHQVTASTERCWIDYDDTFWIISGPVVASLIASLLFMINIIRVLTTKLRPAGHKSNAAAAQKAVRATLILIPLFGLQYAMMPLRPPRGSEYEYAYDVATAIITSTQGLQVVILFCFTNHDVVQACKGLLKHEDRRNEIIPMTGISGGDSALTATRARSSRDCATPSNSSRDHGTRTHSHQDVATITSTYLDYATSASSSRAYVLQDEVTKFTNKISTVTSPQM